MGRSDKLLAQRLKTSLDLRYGVPLLGSGVNCPEALRSGLLSDSIRAEIKPVLENQEVTDLDLIKIMGHITAQQTERSQRLRHCRPTVSDVSVKSAETVESKDNVPTVPKPPKVNPFDKIHHEVKNLRADIAVLASKLKTDFQKKHFLAGCLKRKQKQQPSGNEHQSLKTDQYPNKLFSLLDQGSLPSGLHCGKKPSTYCVHHTLGIMSG